MRDHHDLASLCGTNKLVNKVFKQQLSLSGAVGDSLSPRLPHPGHEIAPSTQRLTLS